MVITKKPPKAGTNPPNEELHAAARSGDLEAVQRICSADPLAINSRDRHSRTPLHLAAWSGHTNIVEYLCKIGDVGAAAMDDMGAIHFAAQKGHLDVIRLLLASGISVKSTNRKGMTALHYAAQGSHVELVKYLMKKGANPNAKNKAGKTPGDLAKNEEVQSALVVSVVDKEECAEEEEVMMKKREEEEEVMMKKREEEEEEEGGSGNNDGESVKRKIDEEDLPEVKKTKVALNHLLDDADDDANDEE